MQINGMSVGELCFVDEFLVFFFFRGSDIVFVLLLDQ